MNKEQTVSYLREALRLETDINTQRRSMNWMKKKNKLFGDSGENYHGDR